MTTVANDLNALLADYQGLLPTSEGRSSATVLTEAEARALYEALDDEHLALATYDQVVRDLGPVRPFTHVRESEARHVDALVGLLARYGLDAPPNPWPGKVPRFASLREACEAAVEVEVENHALYERCMRSTQRPDVLAVYRRLESASRERHLPAFHRCAVRAGRGSRPR